MSLGQERFDPPFQTVGDELVRRPTPPPEDIVPVEELSGVPVGQNPDPEP